MDSLTAENEHKNLRQTLGCFATGVAVVTTLTDSGQPCGLTINSFSSVSLNPPLILWSLSRDSARLAVFKAAPAFVVNILAKDQLPLCKRFSSAQADLFSGVAWAASPKGQPVLNDVVASLECRTWKLYEGGDHIIILGEVVAHHHTNKAPLIFSKGQFAGLED